MITFNTLFTLPIDIATVFLFSKVSASVELNKKYVTGVSFKRA